MGYKYDNNHGPNTELYAADTPLNPTHMQAVFFPLRMFSAPSDRAYHLLHCVTTIFTYVYQSFHHVFKFFKVGLV